MSKKSILLKEKIELVKKAIKLPLNVDACSVKDAICKIVEQTQNSKVEIVFKEKDYKRYSGEFFSCLKSTSVNYSTLIVEKNCKSFYSSKTLSAISQKVCIVVGDDEFIKATNTFCSSKKIKCYAFLTSPYFTEILKDEYFYIDKGKSKSKKVKPIECLFLDQNVIKKCSVYETLKSYVYCLMQAITLIDYKFSSMLTGKTTKNEYYDLLKQSLNYALNFSSYDSPSKVLTLASFIINAVDSDCDVIKNSTAYNYIKVANLLNDDCSLAKLYFVGFEKLVKLYHFFFSNDFSDVLLFPNYIGDLQKLSLIDVKGFDELYENLKVPSAKRVGLICKLLKVVGDSFLDQTSQFIKILPSIEKGFYLQLDKENKNQDIDGEDIKNALRLSTYLTTSQNVLVVMRDFGLLNWQV